MSYRGVAVAVPHSIKVPIIPTLPPRNPENEKAERLAVIKEAREFIGTPYHHQGAIKGIRGGVDCAYFPYLVYLSVNLIPVMELGNYTPDWFMHQGEEIYLPWADALARRVTEDEVQPGDFVLYRVGRLYSHGAIVDAPGWPSIIHSDRAAGQVIEARGDGGTLADAEHIFFSLWGNR